MNSATLTTGPLTVEELSRLQSLTGGLSADKLLWMSGYLAGLSAARSTGEQSPTGLADQASGAKGEKIAVLYASQTGNGQKLAARLREQLPGFAVTVQDVADYKRSQLKTEKHLFLIASTHGEGDPPDLAAEFYHYLMGKKAPRLEGLGYSVLALGDSSYEKYCQIGRDFDQRLKELGAQPLVPRMDCDQDYQDAAEQWIGQVARCLTDKAGGKTAAARPLASALPVKEFSRKHPFAAEILDNILLNGRGSAKEVRHIELSLGDSGLEYKPGDSMGVIAENPPRLVELVLEALGCSGGEPVRVADQDTTLHDALTSLLGITRLTRPVLEAYNRMVQSQELTRMLAAKDAGELQEWIYDRDLLDLLTAYPQPGLGAQDLVTMLRKLPARLYSIASSYHANPGEVHLTVAALRYSAHGRQRVGTASVWLSERREGTVPLYVAENPNFRLPEELDLPIIMVGPGTGIAPFRAFVEERQAQGASGRNWLFFGEQHFRTDFLYQREWLGHLKSGSLHRLDVAFSRDQAEKIYVQHRMLERGRELYEWLDNGAIFYVCGDAKRMALDVRNALLAIVRQHGGLSDDAAEDYVLTMQRAKRYRKDVY